MAGPDAARPSGADAPRVTPEAAAEAAVWVARLHGPSRSPLMERECLEWQSRSPVNREAFERCTETWQNLAGLSLSDVYAAAPATDTRSTGERLARRWVPALALAVVATCSALVIQGWRAEGVHTTGIGEQQRVLLGDGTRLTLNTDTRLDVDMGSAERMAAFEHGEALFEVAKDPKRPFVVRVSGTEVVGQGTTFTVRFTPAQASVGESLAVTLLDGQLAVRASDVRGALAPTQTRQMQPGERMRLVRAVGQGSLPAVTQVDRPNLDHLVAWQRSEAVFDDATLADAVLEMNRYSRTPIVLLEPGLLGPLRVSGLYRVGESSGFARAVAALHGLTLREHQGRLELAKPH